MRGRRADKLQRPAGDRVKTDAKDAVHLARLLRLDEITAVAIPTVDQEAARDLVRAREDCRGDLMRARHRLSKLLLRHGIVYCGGEAWTGKHDIWLRREALPRLDIAGDTDDASTPTTRPCLSVKARRDRLDVAIEKMAADSRVHPTRAPAGVPARDRHPDRVRARGRDRRLAPVHRQHRSARSSASSPAEYSSGESRPGPITKTGNSHARRLLVEAAWHHRARYRVGKTMRERWDLAPAAARVRGDRATGGCTNDGSGSSTAANDTPSPTSPSPANWPAGAGPWPSSTRAEPTHELLRRPLPGGSAWSDPRHNYEQPRRGATLDPRHADALQPNTPSCGNQPAHISLTARRERHAHQRRTDEARGARPATTGTGASPCPLTGSHSISVG